MGLDDLRSILLSERETGKLIQVAPDLFSRTHTEIAALLEKIYAIEDPLSDEARVLIEETIAIRETLHEIFSIRSRKILALTAMHAEGNYYDREEVKRMLPSERQMFDATTSAIEACQGDLLHTTHAPIIPAVIPPRIDEAEEAGEPLAIEDEVPRQPTTAATGTQSPITPVYLLVQVLQDMDSFMGVDGRTYTLAKGDIVTLPERNATVLSARNIVFPLKSPQVT